MKDSKTSLNKPVRIYLDDLRTPKPDESDVGWIVVRSYQEFIDLVMQIGLENIHIISLDHDLGDSAMSEYFNNVRPNYELDYNNINEKTGYDCAKWLVNHFYDLHPGALEQTRLAKIGSSFNFPQVYTHSANPIGSANIIGYINNFLRNERQPQTCVRVQIPHTVEFGYLQRE